MLKQSTARNLMVFLTDSTDHVTGLAGATLTITLSKNGAAFASISPTVTERGNGWYNIALTSSHTDTLGDLVLLAPALGTGIALQHPEWPLWVFQLLALWSGVGGGNFASSMSNISTFFPKRLQGTALGLNAF